MMYDVYVNAKIHIAISIEDVIDIIKPIIERRLDEEFAEAVMIDILQTVVLFDREYKNSYLDVAVRRSLKDFDY